MRSTMNAKAAVTRNVLARRRYEPELKNVDLP
jgi:hypothetical protein